MTLDRTTTITRPSPWTTIVVATLLFQLAVALPAIADESIAVLPAQIELHGPAAQQLLVVERIRDGRNVGQIADDVEFVSSNPDVVVIADGVAQAIGNGEATISVTAGERTATAAVKVTAFDEPFTWSFRNHVQSVLAKMGCSSGACHGAAAGKDGFKLSLRGYDAESDYLTLTRRARGRRVVPADPGRSLILIKPTGAVPHGGGLRFAVNSREYRVISEWIAAGTPAPSDDDPQLERLQFAPEGVVLEPAATQQLLVLAHFSDGHTEDVTRWVKYTSANLSVAEVDDHGIAQVVGHGEGAITGWYLSKVATATVTVPYPNEVDPAVFANAEKRNFIDELVLEELEKLNMPPSPAAGDAEFLRRAYLDTIGILPTVERTRAFLADDSPSKRDDLIEELLQRPEFVDYWAYKWSDLLLVNSSSLPAPAMWSYYNWIRNHVAANTPWDEFARSLVTATGSTLENGATNFYVLHKDAQDRAETVSQAFLGMSITCAKCHNHPLEKWTNDEYYAMANLFGRVRTKDASGAGNEIIFNASDGDVIQPLTGEPQPPKPLDGEPLALDDPTDRRAHLAGWLTSPENPYFTRAITNRVWANFMNVGLVENVDDLRLTNPASNERLLSALADHLVEHDYDLKALMRVILQSATYQRSSVPLPENSDDQRFYSRYYPRRMMAEVLIDAISQVTGVPSEYPNYPKGWRAIQLPDTNVDSYFLKTFGRPDRVITCECERNPEPSLVQVLHISNGDAINKKLETEGNRIDQLLDSGADNAAMIEEAFLTALTRMPTDEEKNRLLGVMTEASDVARRTLIEDLYWGLLSSKEFLFNH